MTKLDSYQPEGEPIHPYDMFLKMNNSPGECWAVVRASPEPEDEADYFRNLAKGGAEIVFCGKKYFETTRVVPSDAAKRKLGWDSSWERAQTK